MRVGQCEAWVTCDGQRLPEYCTKLEELPSDDGTQPTETIGCFIPSEAGKVRIPS